ncbi:MAG: hypothetical protein GY718_09665 [Lentisphaerae bacterium]|nr:hypothetical protein [Lentisphaerota bacterium]
MITSYPKIYAMGHRAINDLFSDEVHITEKIDGSQISFGVYQGELMVKSKGCNLVIDAPDKMFAKAVESIKSIQHLLEDGWTYRGEYLKTPKHNTLEYDRIPVNHIILFDVDTGIENYMKWDDMWKEGIRIGLEVVPLVYYGTVDDPNVLLGMLKRTSTLGGQEVEGVVVKNYHRFGVDGKALMGKYVSEAFKEVHQGNWKKKNPGGGDILYMLGEQYRSDARWNKSICRTRDGGLLKDEPSDIGPLIKDIQGDVKEECEDEIKEALFKWAWPKIVRRVTAGFPEYYKKELLKTQFDNFNIEKGNHE